MKTICIHACASLTQNAQWVTWYFSLSFQSYRRFSCLLSIDDVSCRVFGAIAKTNPTTFGGSISLVDIETSYDTSALQSKADEEFSTLASNCPYTSLAFNSNQEVLLAGSMYVWTVLNVGELSLQMFQDEWTCYNTTATTYVSDIPLYLIVFIHCTPPMISIFSLIIHHTYTFWNRLRRWRCGELGFEYPWRDPSLWRRCLRCQQGEVHPDRAVDNSGQRHGQARAAAEDMGLENVWRAERVLRFETEFHWQRQ